MPGVRIFKNPNAKMSKAIYRITQRCSYRLGLTGTPVCKGYEDLFMQYKIIDPEIFGRNYRDFEREYILKGSVNAKANNVDTTNTPVRAMLIIPGKNT